MKRKNNKSIGGLKDMIKLTDGQAHSIGKGKTGGGMSALSEDSIRTVAIVGQGKTMLGFKSLSEIVEKEKINCTTTEEKKNRGDM